MNAAEEFQEAFEHSLGGLSLTRPSELPDAAPRGRIAKPRTWYDESTEPGYKLTPLRLRNVFYEADQGWWVRQCDLIDDVKETDGTLRNLLDQRENASASKPWSIQPDGVDGDAVLGPSVLHEALKALRMRATLKHQLGAVGYGAAVSEIDWDVRRIDGRDWIVPVWFANVPARRFRIDPKTDELRLLTDAQPVLGEALAPGKWWVTRMAESRLARSGLGRTFAWLAMFKRRSTAGWVSYGDKFGMPQLLLELAENADPATKAVAREVVERFGQDGGGVVYRPTGPGDTGLVVHMQQASAADSASTFGALITFSNREMAKLINGSTLSSDNADSGGASYALGEVHAATRWETVVADALMITESFERDVVASFWKFNGLRGAQPKLEIQVVRDLEPKDLLEAAKHLNDLGVPISVAQLRQLTGLRAPIGDGDQVGATLRATDSGPPRAGAEETTREPGVGAPAAENVQATALNGAQVASMLEIVARVARKELSRQSGRASLMLAFQLSAKQADDVLGPEDFVPAAPSSPPAASPTEDAA